MDARVPALWQRPPFSIIGLFALWCAMALSSLVVMEPAPADLLIMATMAGFFLLGLRLPRRTAPLVAALGLIVVCGLVAVINDGAFITKATMYVVLTAYLGLSAVFLASLVAAEPERSLRVIFSGYAFAAVAAALLAVIGVFDLLPGAFDRFTEFGRARAMFKDPNVFGPFLVLPTLHLAVRAFKAPAGRALWLGALALLLATGLLLSFSRGAWGALLLGATVTVVMVLATTPDGRVRTRVIVTSMVVIAVATLAAAAVLGHEGVSKMFADRFALAQSYDVSVGGRFASQHAAIDFALHEPLGVGGVAFARDFGLEPHNVYIKSFLIGGWLGGLVYALLVVSTLAVALNLILRHTGDRDIAIVLFATFLVTALQGLFIDSDHWRHFYVLLGCIWGLHAAHPARLRAGARARPQPLQTLAAGAPR